MHEYDIKDCSIGISEAKAKLSELIREQKMKFILKNNKPVSVIMPYEEYLKLINKNKE